MPGAPQTAWGVWGAPEPIKAWEHGAPKLHSEIGGTVDPRFADTLQWFYGRALNLKDKEHCLRLLSQISLKQEEEKKKKAKKLQVQGRSLKSQNSQKRPYSAKVPIRPRATDQIQLDRPKSAIPNQSKSTDPKSSYERQKESVDRLSKPKVSIQVPENKHRPKSAMAAISTHKSYKDPYLTTHEREYQGYPGGLYAEATRPSSTKGYTAPYDLSGPIGGTTAEQEFGWKKAAKIEPIRSGTSSGNRRNNPHPHQSFMVWKLPKETAKGMVTDTAPHLRYRNLTPEVMDQIISDQLKSTYQSDYLGVPQGYQVKTAIDAPPDWRTQIRRPQDTTIRYSYLRPKPSKELVGNTTRYGCNKAKSVPALGVVPTVTACHVKNQGVIKAKTSYETHFRDRFDQPDLEQRLQNQPNKKAYELFLKYSKSDPSQQRLGSATSQTGPKWVTKWEGPHHQDK